MSKVYNPALQERLESYLANSGISQAKLAPKVGISQTALSQYRRSKYDNGDIAELERKLEEFFRTEEAVEAAAVKAAPYRPTLDYIPKLEIKFVGTVGIPPNMDDLTQTLRDILPAHLEWTYVYIFNTWSAAGALTWGQASTRTWQEMREREIDG